MTDARTALLEALASPGFRRATFGGTRRNPGTPWERVTARPVALKTGRVVQFTLFDGRKTEARNLPPDGCAVLVDDLLAAGYAGIHVDTVEREIDIRTSKKGKVTVGTKARSAPLPDSEPESHNRAKDVPLPEGRADTVLEAMGVMAPGGRVKPTMRAKFTQINEFLKHLSATLDAAGLRDLGRPIRILDAGCGASYLTIATHHYLNTVLRIPAEVLGVDLNPELIAGSAERVARLLPSGPAFECARIGAIDTPADVVVALHACDTATDDALAQAVRSAARVVLCAPCCHRNLNPLIRPEGDAGPLRPVLRHGILSERVADIVTDAFRALLLRVCGYRAEVVEFVSPEHTARNLLIRATRGGPVLAPDAVGEYRAMKAFWGVTPYLEGALPAESRLG